MHCNSNFYLKGKDSAMMKIWELNTGKMQSESGESPFAIIAEDQTLTQDKNRNTSKSGDFLFASKSKSSKLSSQMKLLENINNTTIQGFAWVPTHKGNVILTAHGIFLFEQF